MYYGPEFVSGAILEWLVDAGIHTAHIEPGKPWQNGTDESFNGKLRDECLSAEWFRSREEARVIIETWRRHYNAVRPHSRPDIPDPCFAAAQRSRCSRGVRSSRRRTAGAAAGFANLTTAGGVPIDPRQDAGGTV